MTGVFLLGGRISNQDAAGGTQPGGTLTLTSTRSATKGYIYFGSTAHKMALDELNGRLGIGTDTPAAKLHLVGEPAALTFATATSSTGTGYQRENGSNANLYLSLAKSAVDDSTYITDTGTLTSNTISVVHASVPPQATTATITIYYRYRWNGTDAGAGGIQVNVTLTDGNNVTIHNTGNIIVKTAHQSGDTGFVSGSFVLTPTEIGNITSWSNVAVNISAGGGGTGYSGTLQWSWAALSYSGGSGLGSGDPTLVMVPDASQTANQTEWRNSANTVLASVSTAGKLVFASAAGSTPLQITSGGAADYWLRSDATGNAGWQTYGALTKTDDTNVTLTLGGTPTKALLAATSLTLGWTGTLSVARGGTGGGSATAGFDNLSPLTTLGDTLYHDGTHNVRLAGNTTATKKFLSQTGNGSISAAPSWSTIPASGLSYSYVAVTGTYSVLASDYYIDATSGTFTITLPTAVGASGQTFVIKNSGTGVVTVATTGGQTIDGGSTAVLQVRYVSITVVSDGSNWKVT
jgi:hypothetical protein